VRVTPTCFVDMCVCVRVCVRARASACVRAYVCVFKGMHTLPTLCGVNPLYRLLLGKVSETPPSRKLL